VGKLTHIAKKNPCLPIEKGIFCFRKGNMFKRTGKHPVSLKYFIKTIGYGLKSQDLYKRDVWISGKNAIPRWLKSIQKYLNISYEGKVTYPKLKLNDKFAVTMDIEFPI
jgi:hypothetical protein